MKRTHQEDKTHTFRYYVQFKVPKYSWSVQLTYDVSRHVGTTYNNTAIGHVMSLFRTLHVTFLVGTIRDCLKDR